ncbi:MAG: YwaF family protein, partial [Oscillospiraceae bacterium]|nr:YwaF family protein [Oscillospiraceae bacterium]
PKGVGFHHYDSLHLTWLALITIFIVTLSYTYKRQTVEKRNKTRKILAAALVVDELWKMFWLTVGHRYELEYLPLHLCSINIFLIAYHCFRPNKTLDNFLYIVCIPGALAALLFPSWSALPFANFMHVHSFTVHALLVAYPVILLVSGEIKPDIKELPKALLLLLCFGIVALAFNIVFDENFMFLMYADPGNPLYLFEQAFGSHVIGFPVIIAGILLVMYGIPALFRKFIIKKDSV